MLLSCICRFVKISLVLPLFTGKADSVPVSVKTEGAGELFTKPDSKGEEKGPTEGEKKVTEEEKVATEQKANDEKLKSG